MKQIPAINNRQSLAAINQIRCSHMTRLDLLQRVIIIIDAVLILKSCFLILLCCNSEPNLALLSGGRRTSSWGPEVRTNDFSND